MKFIGIILTSMGLCFHLVSVIGLATMESDYEKLQVVSKASTFGILCMLIGAWFFQPSLIFLLKSCVLMMALYLALPIATHKIAVLIDESSKDTKKNRAPTDN